MKVVGNIVGDAVGLAEGRRVGDEDAFTSVIPRIFDKRSAQRMPTRGSEHG
jgi:hypothetical protein